MANLSRQTSAASSESCTRPGTEFGPHSWELFWCSTVICAYGPNALNYQFISRQNFPPDWMVFRIVR